MSANTHFVIGGVLAVFGIIFSTALFILFRRVAELKQTLAANAQETDFNDDIEDRTVEASDTFEDDTSFVHFSQRHFHTGPTRLERQRPATAPSIAEEKQRGPLAISFDDALAAYNALAANFGQAELHAFEQRWHPESVTRTAENWLAEDRHGDFWLIRTGETGNRHGLVVPGPDVVRKWELYYRSMGSLAAKNLLVGLYDVGDSAPLRLQQPAIATQTESGWKVETPGTFADS